MVGLAFLEAGLVYMIVVIPIGHWTERRTDDSRFLKNMIGDLNHKNASACLSVEVSLPNQNCVVGSGFFCLFLCFFILGPWNVGFDTGPLFGNWAGVFIAMTLEGLGSALGFAGESYKLLAPANAEDNNRC